MFTLDNKTTDLNQIKEALAISLPLIQQVFPLDVMFGLTDQEQFLYYLAGKEIDIHADEGMAVPEKSGVKQALLTEQVVSSNIGEAVYGTPFKSTSLPLKNETGEVTGVFTIGISLKNQVALNGAAEHLAVSSSEIRTVTDEIAGTATVLANNINQVQNLAVKVLEELHKTDEILDFIKQVADSSNLLSINASIEAAHAGEHGSGFGVVAKEIRKMADSSTKATKEIEGILNASQNNFKELDVTLSDCFLQSERQAASTEEIAASAQQLAASAENIKEVAQVI
ncbi:methyl-accepting chemotaxis protein [Paenibacillus turicensis]|uniref:methyl-accepting chemotaxis protein n=1 Tax=Paenibacillus turicensis TaxID=160487 RepID=UPI001AEB8AB9